MTSSKGAKIAKYSDDEDEDLKKLKKGERMTAFKKQTKFRIQKMLKNNFECEVFLSLCEELEKNKKAGG